MEVEGITMQVEKIFDIYGIISGIISGVISGIIASYIFHNRIKRIERTKLVISSKIARSFIKTNNGRKLPEYTVKIINSSPQDAYCIRGYVRLRYNRNYLTLNLNFVPILHGDNGDYKPCDYQREYSFRLTQFNDNVSDTVLEIVFMSTDSISGGVMDVQMNTYSNQEMLNALIDGEFEYSTLEIKAKNETTPKER